MRVNYKCPSAAAKARIQLHQASFGDKKINCYFAQVLNLLIFKFILINWY